MKVIKGQRAEQWKIGQKVDSKWELIQQLIPLGLKAVEEELQAEVQAMVGESYSRKEHTLRRWGSSEGSVYLADAKVKVRVPRVRDVESKEEMALESYRQLQKPRVMEDIVFNRVIKGISQRDYESMDRRVFAKASERSLLVIERELKWINESAVRSLQEGLEETLTLHRLNLFEKPDTSLKTTNTIENVNRLIENVIGKVCVWGNSNQRQRWVASAALELQPRLRKI